MEQNTSLSRGTFTSLYQVGAGPWGWWRRNKCYIAILSRGGGGGYVIVIHNRGVMEGEGECKLFIILSSLGGSLVHFTHGEPIMKANFFGLNSDS